MSNSTQVIDLPKDKLPEIRLGSVHSPGAQLTGSRSEVWLCPAYSGSQGVMLYVKPRLTQQQLVAELLVAQVAMAMKLPVPQPYIVSVPPHCVGRPRGPNMLAFGCEQVGPRGLAQPVRSLALMLRMLQTAKAAEGAATLDEWVANDVRGPGDIVFDPEGQVWLIDHEGAFGNGTKLDQAVTNWLADRLRDDLEVDQRDKLLAALRAQATKARRLQLIGSPDDLNLLNSGKITYIATLKFLEDRLNHLDRLLSERVLPDQRYLVENEDDTTIEHDADRSADI